ncbi:hypothetical protein D9611_007949 [Ephemerocybe angulata]|uniref:Peptidase A2 domain-containing protein n=1 Tax=Ephemerocybe angulata TaxID=980116 RepID=A0A8H5CFW2_9AGAR|nr:hypothetical protein D9611_007949 [Tulosesus angulatus]
MEELLSTRFTTSLKDLASISAPAREYLKKMITKKKIAIDNKEKASDLEYQIIALIDLMSTEYKARAVQMCNILEAEEELGEMEIPDPEREEEEEPGTVRVEQVFMQLEELPPAQVFLAQGIPSVPDGAFVVSDPVEQYLNSLEDGEELRPILVARESVSLRTVYPSINKSGKVEVLLDTGSQICSMDADVARRLGISFDPDIVIHLQSANRTTEKTLGLARNIEFDFDGVTAYIQLHIIRRPAYDVLLGRPFDVAMSSEVKNNTRGEQQITLCDPNTGKRITIATSPRGKPPPHVRKEMLDAQEVNFRASRI